jgi:hypothetical protein
MADRKWKSVHRRGPTAAVGGKIDLDMDMHDEAELKLIARNWPTYDGDLA